MTINIINGIRELNNMKNTKKLQQITLENGKLQYIVKEKDMIIVKQTAQINDIKCELENVENDCYTYKTKLNDITIMLQEMRNENKEIIETNRDIKKENGTIKEKVDKLLKICTNTFKPEYVSPAYKNKPPNVLMIFKLNKQILPEAVAHFYKKDYDSDLYMRRVRQSEAQLIINEHAKFGDVLIFKKNVTASVNWCFNFKQNIAKKYKIKYNSVNFPLSLLDTNEFLYDLKCCFKEECQKIKDCQNFNF